MSGYEFTEAGLTELLTTKLDYAPADAARVTAELLVMQPPIRAAFMEWWKSGTLPDHPAYEGFNPATLAVQHGLNPPAAFLTLDWLATDPQTARKALSEGYDTIVTG